MVSTQYPVPTETVQCPDTVTSCRTIVTRVLATNKANNQTQTITSTSYDRACDRGGACTGVRNSCPIDKVQTCVDIICCSNDLCNANVGGIGGIGGIGAGHVPVNSAFLVTMATMFAMLFGL